MNIKIRLLATASLVAIMASGCSSYRGSTQAGTNSGVIANNGVAVSGQVARTGQVARRGFGQQRGTATTATDSCAVCAASKTQSTYTYKPVVPAAPAAKPAPKPAPKPVAGTHNQQYYIDRWNRQQAQQGATAQTNTNYAGYGQTGSNTTYYDYSTAATTTKPATTATSNKSIYTGSYQQKTYTPTTYSGGTAATTNTTVPTVTASGGSNYIVKKGDTVFEIMRQTGVYWKDIISINNLQPPYAISPGQTLRLK